MCGRGLAQAPCEPRSPVKPPNDYLSPEHMYICNIARRLPYAMTTGAAGRTAHCLFSQGGLGQLPPPPAPASTLMALTTRAASGLVVVVTPLALRNSVLHVIAYDLQYCKT